MKKIGIFMIVFSGFLWGNLLWGQQIMIDRGVQSAGLWCFPVFGDSSNFLYLPSRARLATDKDSVPEFSFLRYITEKPSAASVSTISEAGGGGIVNFLVLYDTPDKQVKDAETGLQKKLNNKNIRLRGPVVFDRARYMLVSSILQPNGKAEKEIMATGEAPVLENSRLAFSFDVDPMRSKLLLESFKMKTPDISLMFELGFSGLTDSYQADLSIDWTEVKKSQSFSAGGSVYFIGADVALGFDELIRNNAIKLNTVGTNESMEALLNTVYSKLLDLMFKRVEPEQVPADQRGGLMDAISGLIGSNGALGSRNTTGFGLNVGYQMKELKTSGKSNLFFRGRSTVSRNHFITFNIGDLYQKHGKNPKMFRDVPLYDPAFQKREVFVGVDGSLEPEFEKLVNSVTVRLKKKHDNGQETVKELIVNSKTYKDSTGKFRFIYLNRADSNLVKWLGYEYQTIWQFTGGGTYTSPWITEEAAMINLFTPYKRQLITLEGDAEGLLQQGYKAISVKINYPFFSEQRDDSITLRPKDSAPRKSFEVTLPLGKEDVSYSIIWVDKDGKSSRMNGKDNIGLIFVDELPK